MSSLRIYNSWAADVAELADAADLGSAALRAWRFESSRRHQAALKHLEQGARGQAGRHLLCTQEIVGSNPTGSTES
jgi:hypothetical protein